MKTCKIHPYKGIGDLEFGAERSATRKLLDSEVTSFSKGLEDSQEVDAYESLGLHLYFDESGSLEFVEVFSPCSPEFDGLSLLVDDVQEVLLRLKRMGYEAEFDDGGYFFHDLGLALYAPSGEVEGVSLYRRGYYDD